MPLVQRAGIGYASSGRLLEDVNFDYDYPQGMDLSPESKLSKKIVEEVNKRAGASKALIDTVSDQWRLIDHKLTAYVDPNARFRKIGTDLEDEGPLPIVVPVSLAALETVLAYMHSVFLSMPIHRYTGFGDKESIVNAAKLERLHAMHSQWFKESMRLDTQWRDAHVYGIGIAEVKWSKRTGPGVVDVELEEVMVNVLKDVVGAKPGDILRMMNEAEELLFEGNELRNIDPYRVLLDPYTPVSEIQKAEFVGWQESTHAMDLIRRESDPEEHMFNGKYVKVLSDGGASKSRYWLDESGREEHADNISTRDTGRTDIYSPVHLTRMMIDIIPEDWGLPGGDRPRKWAFTVAGDSVVVQASPIIHAHGQFPIAVCAPCTSGYDVLPISKLATLYGIADTADWLIRSRVDNVQNGLAGRVIWDPTKVETDDVMASGYGLRVRLKPSGYGQGNIDQWIKTIDVQDQTAGNLNEAGYFMQMMNRIAGTEEISMGDLSGLPERPGMMGIEAAKNGAFSRLMRHARLISEQSMQDIAWQFAYNSIQFMSKEVSVPLLGRYEQTMRESLGIPPSIAHMTINPLDLQPNFQVMPNDGASQSANLQVMSQMVQWGLQSEFGQAALADLDFRAMILQVARKSGFENVDEFLKQGGGMTAQTMPDEQIQQQVQAGNLAPFQEVMA